MSRARHPPTAVRSGHDGLDAAGVDHRRDRPADAVTAALLAGLLAGWAVAVPMGPVGSYLVALSARTPWRTGAAAALGVATTDGAYGVLAVLGGAALADRLADVEEPFRWTATWVLVAVAVRSAVTGLQAPPASGPRRDPLAARPDGQTAGARRSGPTQAYLLMVALTAVNPTTLVAFAALATGAQVREPGQVAVFAAAVTAASASWQLVLVSAGALLGGLLASRSSRVATSLLSSALMLVLAVRTAP